ncbi:unnamed protein product, partial [Chrysoparadoxa australica]
RQPLLPAAGGEAAPAWEAPTKQGDPRVAVAVVVLAAIIVGVVLGITLGVDGGSGPPGAALCMEATAISSFPFEGSGSTVGMNPLGAQSLCGDTAEVGSAPGVWYTFTATSTEPIKVSTCSHSDFDTQLAVFAGSSMPRACGQQRVCIDGNDDTCDLQSGVVVITPVIGQVYTILLTGFNGAAGTYSIE